VISLTLICGFLFTFAFSAASAHGKMAARCSTRQPARAELHCGNRNLWHADHLLKFLSQHPRAGLVHPVRRAQLRRDGRWLRRYALRHIATARARLRPVPPAIPHLSAWLCIHRHEGAWSDSGDPYWGGLQMDRSFMETYAPRYLLARGWANAWTPAEQMMVAERAYSSGRGFWPWPNTARACGLL